MANGSLLSDSISDLLWPVYVCLLIKKYFYRAYFMNCRIFVYTQKMGMGRGADLSKP